MPIKRVGKNLWQIDVALKVNGKQYRRLRKNWSGTESAAIKYHSELMKELEQLAEQQKSENPKKSSQQLMFSTVVQNFIDTRHPYDICSYKRIKEEYEGVPSEAKAMKTFTYGGVDDSGKKISSFVKKMETIKVRKWHGYGTRGTVIELERCIGANAKNKLYRALKAVCVWAVEQEFLVSNPVTERLHWKENPRNRTLSDEELDKLLEIMKVEYPHYLPMFLYNIRNPTRLSDCRNLTKDNLNLENGTIHFITSKKKIPVTQFIFPELEDHFANLPKECPYLFYYQYEEDGEIKYRKVEDFKRAWARAKRLAGIKNLRWHDLRHHALTWLMTKKNLKTHQVMQIGAWSSIDMVNRYHNADHQVSIQEAKKLLDLK